MAEKLRVAVVGFGAMGQAHAEVWSQIPGAEIAAVVDIDSEKRVRATELYTCLTYRHIEDLFAEVRDSPQVDVVVVATQLMDHYESAKTALSHGCHVICEKPFTYHPWQADDLIAEAHDLHRKLAVHHQVVVCDAIFTAKQMLQDKVIGDLYYMESVSKGRLAPYELMEMAIHNLFLMCCFGRGRPTCVSAVVRENWLKADDVFKINDHYPKGRDCGLGLGDYFLARYTFLGIDGVLRLITLPESNNEYASLILHGTKGRLRIHESGGGRLFFHPKPHDDFLTPWQEVEKEKIWGADSFGKKAMKRFAENFLEAIKSGGDPVVSGKDGCIALEMALGIYTSHLAGQPVRLPLENRWHPLEG